ncbi:MAG: HNH endonuclease [Anaerolineae bacterium]
MHYSDFLDLNDVSALASAINARARQAHAYGTISADALRDRIYACGGQCEWCQDALLHKPFEVDHIIPLKRGGSNQSDNIAVSCPACNRSKSAKHPARFAQETYARTGTLTPLLTRVLDHYGAEATTQQTLFADADDAPTRVADDDSPTDDPPPYVWGN